MKNPLKKLKNGVISSIKELFVFGLIFVLLCAAWVVEKFDKSGLSAFEDDYYDDYYECWGEK